MTATIFNSIRAVAGHARQGRRAPRQRTGASLEFRTLVAEFDARRRAGREPSAAPADTPIRPRHVIAAEGILARMRHGITGDETSRDNEPAESAGRARPDRVGPVHALRSAKRIVLSGLDRVDHGLQKALRRHGFDRAEVAVLADAAMSGIPHRAELALNHLPLAPRPVEAARYLFDTALDKIADNLAYALGRHGLGRDRIAEISHVAITGIDERVAAALDGLAESWSRTRGAIGGA